LGCEGLDSSTIELLTKSGFTLQVHFEYEVIHRDLLNSLFILVQVGDHSISEGVATFVEYSFWFDLFRADDMAGFYNFSKRTAGVPAEKSRNSNKCITIDKER
jgi:hypothetical protein